MCNINICNIFELFINFYICLNISFYWFHWWLIASYVVDGWLFGPLLWKMEGTLYFGRWKGLWAYKLTCTSRAGLAGLQRCSVAHTVAGSNHHQCLWIHDLQVCRSKRLGCHAELHTVRRCWLGCHTELHTVRRCCTRGESEEHTGEKASKQARDSPWPWNPGQMSPEVQSKGISGSTKRTCVLQHFRKKRIKMHIL